MLISLFYFLLAFFCILISIENEDGMIVDETAIQKAQITNMSIKDPKVQNM